MKENTETKAVAENDWQPIKAPKGMFFCEACLRDLPLNERSKKDMRYCNFCQPIIGEATKPTGAIPDSWGGDGQIFFTGGKGYGLTDNGQNICLGNEKDILKFFETGELNDELNPTQRQALNQIKEYRKEQDDGENIGTGSLERRGTLRTVRRKQKATRLFKARKRFSLHPSRQGG